MQTTKSDPKRLSFSGYEWTLKSGARMGPGPNRWETANVSLDAAGRLRLEDRAVEERSLVQREGDRVVVRRRERLSLGGEPR